MPLSLVVLLELVFVSLVLDTLTCCFKLDFAVVLVVVELNDSLSKYTPPSINRIAKIAITRLSRLEFFSVIMEIYST